MDTIRRNALVLPALLYCLLSGPLQADCASPPLEFVESETAGLVSGTAGLCFLQSRIRADVRLDSLVPGDVYSVWWAYFDDPSACAIPDQCGYPDLVNDFDAPDAAYPPGTLGRIGALVARVNGKARFADVLGWLKPPDEAELWVVVMRHGPADPVDAVGRARQLLTPEDVALGGTFLGNDADGLRSEWLAVARYAFSPERHTGVNE
jgi:hypothetical protein